jgi:hypothetical protein
MFVGSLRCRHVTKSEKPRQPGSLVGRACLFLSLTNSLTANASAF